MSDKRNDILQNALKLFLKYDYAGTSISMITSSVGISKSTFFNYFKSKDELFNNVFLMCKQKAGESDCLLEESLANFEEHYSNYIKNLDEIKFMSRFEYSEHITKESREKGISFNKKYYNDIVKGQKDGIITKVPPIYLCLVISNAIILSADYVVCNEKIDIQRLDEIKSFIKKILYEKA